MHISSCLNPQRIFNKYTQEFMYVGCGKCEACRNRKAFNWTTRLKYESRCWKYVAFVTLTYSPDNLPNLSKVGNVLCDLSHKHTAPSFESPSVILEDLYKYCEDSYMRDRSWLEKNNFSIPYLSVYDCQCFLKRLRKNLKNLVIKKYGKENVTPTDYQVRYFLCGEYGSTTARPHYHCLFFFSSQKEAACFEESLSKSWKLGIIDFSYVKNEASAYVASYVNSLSKLPKVYSFCKQIRPFALCSKFPPIGSLFFPDEEIQKIFFAASPRFNLPNFEQQRIDNVPLWSTFVFRLFPRLSFFDRVSSNDRVRLYRAFDRWQDFDFLASLSTFSAYMIDCWKNKKFNAFYTHLYHDYLTVLHDNVDNDVSFNRSVHRWLYASSRVCHQSVLFGISVADYVKQIETFYENVQKDNLLNQYQFQQIMSDEGNNCIGFYREMLLSCIDVPLELMDAKEILFLQSFNIDFDKFFNEDPSIRIPYIDVLLPDNQREFITFSEDALTTAKRLVKTKVKNDYLVAHNNLLTKVY